MPPQQTTIIDSQFCTSPTKWLQFLMHHFWPITMLYGLQDWPHCTAPYWLFCYMFVSNWQHVIFHIIICIFSTGCLLAIMKCSLHTFKHFIWTQFFSASHTICEAYATGCTTPFGITGLKKLSLLCVKYHSTVLLVLTCHSKPGFVHQKSEI